MNSPTKQKTKTAGKSGVVTKLHRELLALKAFNDNLNPKRKKIDSDDGSVATPTSSETLKARKSKTQAEEKIKRGGNDGHKKLIDYDELQEIQDFLKGLADDDTPPKVATPKKMEIEVESDMDKFKNASKRLTQAAFGLFDKIELDFESINHEREYDQGMLASKASEKIIKGSPKMEVEEAKENTKPKMIDLLKESLLDIYSDVHDNRLAKINFEPIAEIMRTTKQIDVDKVFPLIDESNKEQEIEEEKESQAFVLQKITLEHLDENHQKINELVQGISESDFQRLDPEVYLNDTLINFYLKFIELGLINRERRNKIHIFNTYFFSKMRQLFTDIASDFTKFDKVYEKLERWTRKIDLLQKDFILIPVNENEHWNMIILCYPQKLYSKDMDFPYVVYLDSICRMDDVYAKMLYNFFMREVKAKRPNDFMTLQAKQYRLNIASFPYYQPMVPKQSNWTDCGLYLLQYTELFAQDESYIIENKEELNKIKWFPRQLIMDKRDEMKGLIQDLKMFRYEAIKEYLDRRRRVMKENARDKDQYDYFDQRGFEKAVANKYGDTDLTAEEIRILKLDYYYLDSLEYDQADNTQS